MSHRSTYVCDSCEKQFLIDETQDLPPYWMAIQMAIADKDGLVPNHEREVYMHFCSQTCLVQYAKSDSFRERACTVDRNVDEEEDE